MMSKIVSFGWKFILVIFLIAYMYITIRDAIECNSVGGAYVSTAFGVSTCITR